MAEDIRNFSLLATFLNHGLNDEQAHQLCQVLDLAPLVLFIVTPCIVYRSTQKPICVKDRYDTLLKAKLLVGTLLLAMQLFHFMLSLSCRDGGALVEPEASMFFEVTCLLALIYTEHKHEPTSSTFLSIYLGFSLFTKVVLALLSVTACYRDGEGLPLRAEVLLRALVLGLHETSKWKYMLKKMRKRYTPESCYGWWIRNTGLWLLPAIHQSDRNGLAVSNLMELPTDMTAQSLVKTFESVWTQSQGKCYPLLRACLHAQQVAILQTVFFRVFQSALKLSFPYFLLHFLQLLDSRQGTELSTSSVEFFTRTSAFAVGTLFFCIAMANSIYLTQSNTTKLRCRTMLVGVLFKRSYALSDADALKSANLSLITSDVTTIAAGLDILLDTTAYAVEVGICSSIMWLLLRRGTILLLALCTAILMAGYFILRLSRNHSTQTADKTTVRSQSVQSMIKDILDIKFTNNVVAIKHLITKVRNAELLSLNRHGWWWSIPQCIVASAHVLMPTLIFLSPYEMRGSPALITSALVLVLFAHAIRDLHKIPSRLLLFQRSMQHIEAQLAMKPASPSPEEQKKASRQPTRQRVVDLMSATIAPSPSSAPVMKNISLTIMRGSLVVITGNVGAGKTTFLRALLGRCTLVGGVIHTYESSVAYCGQDVWIRNATIQQNIIGPAKYDERWFREVVHRCCLTEDIERFPKHQHEHVGYRGCNLNHGQRHRLALARALYSRPKLLLLDDIFSTQSSEHAGCLVARLLRPRCPLRQSATVVVASKNVGLFTDEGPTVFNITDRGNMELYREQPDPHDDGSEDYVKQLVVNCTSDHADKLQEFSEAIASQLQPTTQPIREYGKPRYRALFEKMDAKMTGLCFVMFFIFGFTEVLPLIYIRVWIPLSRTSNFPFEECIWLTLLGEIMFASTTKLLQSQLVRPIQKALHEKLIDATLDTSVEKMTTENVAEASNLLVQGVQTIDNQLFVSIFQLAYDSMILILALSFIASQYLIGAIQLPVCFAAAAALHFAFSPFNYHLSHLEQTTSRFLYASFSEAISGGVYIHTLGWQDHHWKQVRGVINQAQRVYYHSLTRDKLLELCIDLLIAFMTVLTTVITARAGSVSYKAGISLYMTIHLKDSLTNVLKAWGNLDDCVNVLARSDELIELLHTPKTTVATTLPPRWPANGIVEFENTVICPSYPNHWNLRVPQMTIPNKADAGIIAHPQSGKTAILMAILNLVPYNGSIKIDGVEARDVPPDKIHKAFTVIPQRPICIPSATIRQNLVLEELTLDYNKSDNVGDIESILYNLGLLTAINLSGGLHAQFSKLRLTPAQLQRFAVAQALMKFYCHPSRFVLNDSTMSTADADSLERMSKVTRRVFSYTGSTVIQTASQLTTVEDGTWLGIITDGVVKQATWFP